MTKCIHCDESFRIDKNRKSFCSRSCAASYSNLRRTRFKKPPNHCITCGTETRNKFCSYSCFGKSIQIGPDARRTNRNERAAAYRAKVRNQTPSDANKEKIIKLNEEIGNYEADNDAIEYSLKGYQTDIENFVGAGDKIVKLNGLKKISLN